ncbi:hypothetical protein J1605_000828 [Eschrichtius robustus]|uniref:Uncharacterized protein n=1 Tax=Eschrichtius robustus TaxID=9764 RepID=A0AB34GPY5_ESCRO|nr:hypothetical protein J1605_000828 [Eschrichtius robustus]
MPWRRARGTQVALPFARAGARRARFGTRRARECGAHDPDTPSEIHWGWGRLVTELGRRVFRAKSARQVLLPGVGNEVPGRGRVWDGHSATPAAPASLPGFSGGLISCSGKSFASPSPLPPRSSPPPPEPPGLP